MNITFLGTGTSQGIPVIACDCDVCTSRDARDNRTRSSIVVSSLETTIVIDTGPDFRHQMLREKILNVDAVLFTHDHKDHLAGLDDIRPINFKYNKHIDIFCEKNVDESIKREFSYIFHQNKYPGIPLINVRLIDENPFMIHNVTVTPIRVIHKDLPILGYRFSNFAYITDANSINERELEKLKGLDVLVINALRKEKHYSHFNIDDALEIISKVKPQTAYLTHMSHDFGKHFDEERKLPDGVKLAYDGLKIQL